MIPSASLSKRLMKQKKFRQLLFGLFLFALVIGLAIVPVERMSPTANIKNSFEGVYWATTTLTGVGYGDKVPVTTLGRSMAMFLQLMGTLIFGIVIAIIGSYVNRSQDEFYWNRIFERIDRLEEQISELHKQSNFLVKGDRKEEEKH